MFCAIIVNMEKNKELHKCLACPTLIPKDKHHRLCTRCRLANKDKTDTTGRINLPNKYKEAHEKAPISQWRQL